MLHRVLPLCTRVLHAIPSKINVNVFPRKTEQLQTSLCYNLSAHGYLLYPQFLNVTQHVQSILLRSALERAQQSVRTHSSLAHFTQFIIQLATRVPELPLPAVIRQLCNCTLVARVVERRVIEGHAPATRKWRVRERTRE